jgi:hypothetical protein
MMLDARADFPSWKGHLIAYETTDTTKCPGGTGPVPCLLWDTAAVTFSDPNLDAAQDATKPYLSWKSRRIYTSSGKTLVALNDGTGNVPSANVTTLFNAGLGATSTEVNTIAQWMMGTTNSTICSIGGTTCATDTDCSSKITGDTCGKAVNPATLGTFVNSTPIGVGPPGLSPLPGGQDFYNKFKNRPELIYVAADDGMLHAFFARDTTLGTASFKGGSEAFAYIPPQMLRTVTNLYAQGGQFPHPDDHIYGMAASAKVKNICVANCTSTATPSTADWRTVLVIGEGQGGNDVVMLDVTNPFSGSGTNPFVANGLSSTPVGVLWNTGDANALPSPPNTTLQSSYDSKLGQTLSVPAFAIGKTASTTYDDYRVVMASGYAPGGYTNFTPNTANQGLTIVSVKAADGTMLDSQPPATTSTTCSTVERTMLGDVATARNNQSGEQGQIVAGFYGDTWGDLWQYVPGVGTGGSTSSTGTVSKIFSFGCQAPLHFSPTVVQLDRDNPGNYSNNIFLAQVTNSPLDRDSQGFSQSALGIMKVLYTGTAVTWDGTWIMNPGTTGQVTNICADTSVSPCTKLTSSARPTSTPIAILKADGSGFELFAAWYVPPPNGCTFGATYLTVHEIQGGGTVVQKLGRKLADQQVTNVVLVGGKAMFLDRNAALQDVTGYLPFAVKDGKSAANPTAAMRFKRLGWSELP